MKEYKKSITESDDAARQASAMRETTERAYPQLVSQGYRWDTNVSNENAEELARVKRVEGLDVVVGDLAFIPKPIDSRHISALTISEILETCTRDPTAKAILVRKPKKV